MANATLDRVFRVCFPSLSGRSSAPSGRCAFTLLELMVAMALTAVVLAALAGVVFQAVRLSESLGTRNRVQWRTDRILHDCIRAVACACDPPGLSTNAPPFVLETGDGGASPLLRVSFFAPAGPGNWSTVQPIAYELWPAPRGLRELRRLDAPPPSASASSIAWRTNILYAGDFDLGFAVRAAPAENGGAWGEWRDSWPMSQTHARRAGDDSGTADAELPPPLPGAARLEFRLRGEPPVVLETVVHAAQPPLRPVAPAP